MKKAREIHDKIESLLRERGIRPSVYAEAIGMHLYTYYKWKSSISLPSLELIYATAKYLGVTVEELVGDDDDGNL